MLVFGPACGFILGSFCTKIYVDAVFIDTSKEFISISKPYPQALSPSQRSPSPLSSKTLLLRSNFNATISLAGDPLEIRGKMVSVGSEGLDSSLCSAHVCLEA